MQDSAKLCFVPEPEQIYTSPFAKMRGFLTQPGTQHLIISYQAYYVETYINLYIHAIQPPLNAVRTVLVRTLLRTGFAYRPPPDFKHATAICSR